MIFPSGLEYNDVPNVDALRQYERNIEGDCVELEHPRICRLYPHTSITNQLYYSVYLSFSQFLIKAISNGTKGNLQYFLPKTKIFIFLIKLLGQPFICETVPTCFTL